MRWSERQLAMLREMGIPPFWPQARAEAEPGVPVAVAEVAQVAQVAERTPPPVERPGRPTAAPTAVPSGGAAAALASRGAAPAPAPVAKPAPNAMNPPDRSSSWTCRRRWPSPAASLRLVLLQDGREVKKRHLLFSPEPPRPSLFGYGSLEGFYETRGRTIYLSLKDLHEGILAHEMAHFVFCNALPTPPPEHEQEAWARYVESQL